MAARRADQRPDLGEPARDLCKFHPRYPPAEFPLVYPYGRALAPNLHAPTPGRQGVGMCERTRTTESIDETAVAVFLTGLAGMTPRRSRRNARARVRDAPGRPDPRDACGGAAAHAGTPDRRAVAGRPARYPVGPSAWTGNGHRV